LPISWSGLLVQVHNRLQTREQLVATQIEKLIVQPVRRSICYLGQVSANYGQDLTVRKLYG
jgi:hypothetical protein